MNMLSSMLWAWAGVSALGVLAAVVIVVAQASVEEREAASAQESVARAVVLQAGGPVDAASDQSHGPPARDDMRPR